MEPTPDTSAYMVAGYALTFIVLGIYLLSIYIRNRNLKRDLETLQSLKSEAKKK
jgi:hypothetical protein